MKSFDIIKGYAQWNTHTWSNCDLHNVLTGKDVLLGDVWDILASLTNIELLSFSIYVHTLWEPLLASIARQEITRRNMLK